MYIAISLEYCGKKLDFEVDNKQVIQDFLTIIQGTDPSSNFTIPHYIKSQNLCKHLPIGSTFEFQGVITGDLLTLQTKPDLIAY